MNTEEFEYERFIDPRQNRDLIHRMDKDVNIIEMSISGRCPRDCFGDTVNNIELGDKVFRPIRWYPEPSGHHGLKRITIYFSRINKPIWRS